METINVNALKAKFGRVEKLSEPKYRFSRFLASADLSADGTYGFVRRLLINYGKENNVDIERYLKSSLNFTNINRDEVNICISEFIDVLNSIPDKNECKKELTYIGKLLDIIESNGKVDSNTVDDSFNHDRIPRHIAMYFFSKVDENYWKDRNKSREDVYKELNENVEGRFSNVIYDIRLLQGDISRGDNNYTNNNYIWASNFLNVFRFLRNWKDHFADNITKDDERCAAACFILYTFAANYYAIKKNLIKHGVKDIKDVVIKEKTLSVFFNGELDESILSEDINEARKLLEPILYEINEQPVPHNETSNKYKYDFTIKREGKYKLKIGEGGISEDLDMEKLWDSPSKNPVVIWNGVHPYFFSDLTNVPSQLNQYVKKGQDEETKKLREAIEIAKRAIEQNTDTTNDNTASIKSLEETLRRFVSWIRKILEKFGKWAYFLLAAVILGAISLLITMFLLVVSNKDKLQSLFVHPETIEAVIAKGDQYFRDNNPEKAGETYRKAISMYRDTLAQDSNNVKANIGLAMMLMRGLGNYDPEEAEKLVSRIKGINSRAEGLYAYLLVRNGKPEEAGKLIDAMDEITDTADVDEYTRLSYALLTIYGVGDRHRNNDIIRNANETIGHIRNQEAVLECALISLNGVEKDEPEDSYWIYPEPIGAIAALSVLAEDSLNALAMALAGDQYTAMHDVERSLNYTACAWKLGMNDYVPLLRMRMSEFVDIADSDEKIQKLWDDVSRLSRNQESSIAGEFSNFIQQQSKYLNDKLSASKLLESLDKLIDFINQDKKSYYKYLLPNLYRGRVSLCLESGEFSRAVKVAMECDECRDSMAVADYLKAICYNRGWNGVEKDTILRDSLIFRSADKGYIEAIYSRLRKSKPIEEELLLVDPTQHFSSIEYYDVMCPNKTFVFVEGEAEVVGWDDLSESERKKIEKERETSRNYVKKWHYKVPSYANVPDSIWQKSPKLADLLADYWWPYYTGLNELPPYLGNCTKEYRTMYEIRAMAYELVDMGNGKEVLNSKQLPQTLIEDYLLQIQAGISSALRNANAKMVQQLATMWLTLADQIKVDPIMKANYEDFALPSYKENKTFKPYVKPDNPVYAY